MANRWRRTRCYLKYQILILVHVPIPCTFIKIQRATRKSVITTSSRSSSAIEMGKLSGKTPPLLPVPEWLAKPNDRLCDSCADLNITPSDFLVSLDPLTYDAHAEDIMTFGLLRDVKAKSSSCPLCRVFLQSLGEKAIPDEEDGVPIEVTYHWFAEPQVVDSEEDTYGSGNNIPYVQWLISGIQRQGGGYCSNSTTVPFLPRIGLLANDAPKKNISLLPRIIGAQIDFGMVRGWIETCKARHGDQCWGPHPDLEHHRADILDELPSFQVIDVIDKCLTPAPRKCKYAALSYVWGSINPASILRRLKSNVSALQRPGSLDQADISPLVPRTIRDAMYVVEQLNMRYIWVDSLCIIQDDDGEGGTKMQSLASMANIYGGADLVIVAACGVDAHSGLPGLRPGAPRKQPIEEISPGFRLGFKRIFQTSYMDSVYVTRAWTFQEAHLARKQLIFVDEQVVYNCKVIDQLREDEVCEGRHTQSEETDDESSEAFEGDDIGEVQQIIFEYSSRSITRDTDLYHALSAMRFIVKKTIGANLCHGIPDTLFDWFLLWEPADGRQTRRNVGPSWSWSGWLGRSSPDIWSTYTRSIVSIRNAQPRRTWIVWYQRKAHDSHDFTRVDKSRTKKQDAASTKRMQKRLPFDCTRTEPTPRKLNGAPSYLEDTYYPHPGSGFLQFWTISVRFNLGNLASALTDEKLQMQSNGYQFAGIFGGSGRELGDIMLDPAWFNTNVPGRHEFIVLCEGRTESVEYNEDPDTAPGWKYRIMLIEWKGDGQWAERVAVGAIRMKDLNEALDAAVWKEIILG